MEQEKRERQQVDYVWVEILEFNKEGPLPDEKFVRITVSGRVWNDSGHAVLNQNINCTVGRGFVALPDEAGETNKTGVQNKQALSSFLNKIGPCESIPFKFEVDLQFDDVPVGKIPSPRLKIWAEFRYDGKFYKTAAISEKGKEIPASDNSFLDVVVL